MNLNTALVVVLVALFTLLGFMGARWGPPEQRRGLPSVISTQQLVGKTIRDDAAKRCFTVVQQDGQPRFVPADCPKGK